MTHASNRDESRPFHYNCAAQWQHGHPGTGIMRALMASAVAMR
jgi:hypothetical protein